MLACGIRLFYGVVLSSEDGPLRFSFEWRGLKVVDVPSAYGHGGNETLNLNTRNHLIRLNKFEWLLNYFIWSCFSPIF